MNRWQEIFKTHYYGEREIQDKTGIRIYEVLGNIDDEITVHMPKFEGVKGLKPAHTETYRLYEDRCDTRNGIISVPVLSLYLKNWFKNGYKIECSHSEEIKETA